MTAEPYSPHIDPMTQELFRLSGEVAGLSTLLREGLIPKIDAHIATDDGRHENLEHRLREAEKSLDVQKGGRATSGRWLAHAAALVTLAVNGALAWFGVHPIHGGH